jgi:predicted O-methyltransferase YrrM
LNSIESTDHFIVKVQEYISQIFPEHSDTTWSELEQIAKLTALRRSRDGEYFISNSWRGPMLYSLVRRLKPRLILELGTGRGYGAFSMAKALVDGDINGRLITVDRTPVDRRIEWPHVNSVDENVITNSSLGDFWKKELPDDLNQRIEFRQGDTASVHQLLNDHQGEVDLVFIDSDHTYNGVKLDFLSAHSITTENAVFVFDDYSATSGYGIRKLVDNELSHSYSVKIIDMELTASHDISVDHMMAICNDEASEIHADLPSPYDFRFRYLKMRRWVRSQLVRVARATLRRS